MGHSEEEPEWRIAVRARRLHEMLRKRFLSFLSAYTVIVVAIVLFFFAVKWRQAPCQKTAKAVDMIITIPEEYAKYDIWSAAISGLDTFLLHANSRANISDTQGTTSRSFYFVDSPGHMVRDNSMQVRFTDGYNDKNHPYMYAIRFVSSDICTDRPLMPLDVEYNVDTEYSVHRVHSVSDGINTRFLFEHGMRTGNKNRLLTTSDMMTVFPVLRGVTGLTTQFLITDNKMEAITLMDSPIFYRNGNLLPSLKIALERWRASKFSFYVLRVTFHDAEEETLAVMLFRAIRDELQIRGIVCASTARCNIPLTLLA